VLWFFCSWCCTADAVLAASVLVLRMCIQETAKLVCFACFLKGALQDS
jgi:hypothetical protein